MKYLNENLPGLMAHFSIKDMRVDLQALKPRQDFFLFIFLGYILKLILNLNKCVDDN